MHEKYHFLGVSPDGLVTCLCHESSLLEVKCPAKHKDNLSISDCIATDKDIVTLKACYFVIWTPMLFYLLQ